ncbi:MAG TPA: hypothetical protein VME23_08020 [Terracidiphilus sp.]|nr:hypothetical protein [Terracidiphilus sp.]
MHLGTTDGCPIERQQISNCRLRALVLSSIGFGLFLVATATHLSSQAPRSWSTVLAPSRATDWSNAGVPGGIPNRTTICANVATTDTTKQIQEKIDNCPANQVVMFPVGTWNLTLSIYAHKGIVLRGAGPTKTIINLPTSGYGDILFSVDGTGENPNGLPRYPPNLGSTKWTGGLTKGSTVLTLASTAGIVAGQRIVLDQYNAPYIFTSAINGKCDSHNSCGRNDNPLQFFGADSRAQQEMVQVESVNSPTQITITAPGVAYDHSASLSPEAFYWNTHGANGPGNISYAGVEDMQINANFNNFAISMGYCDYCWTKNVTVTNLGRTAVFFLWGTHDEVRDSYFSSRNTSGGPTQYGIELISTSFAKVENNIFFGVTASILPETSYALVAGYNYILNTAPGPQFGSFEPHLAHNYLQLYEGNVLDEIMYDNVWGSSSHNTAFRNRASGHSPNKTSYRVAIKVNADNHYMNIVGNVIGDPTFHTHYQCDNVDRRPTDDFEFDLGFWGSCQNGIDSDNPYDTVTESSLMRWGNWDAVTYLANGSTNGVRWCTGAGVGNPACTGSESASTDPEFPGLAHPSQILPSSFYLTAKPSWFGDNIWPPIGPDVNCSTNCIANTANHAAKIPAQLCYENTAKNSAGFLTAFDAKACYERRDLLPANKARIVGGRSAVEFGSTGNVHHEHADSGN